MIRATRSTVIVGLLLSLSVGVARGDEPAAKPAPSQDQLDKQFTETMSRATLVGNFTIVGEKSDKPLKEDRYTLGEVKKLKNGLWLFNTRIQYGDHDVKVPLALDVKWAGTTPVITLDNVLVPGLGTFTSRVVVHGTWYAGTWSGGGHGGHLFGKIEHDSDDAKPADRPAGAN